MKLQPPLPGFTVGDTYGWRETVYDRNGNVILPASLHDGIDYPAPSGTPVRAAAAGIVETVAYNSLSGNYITIRHGDGSLTWYSHLSTQDVSRGRDLAAGDRIGTVGSTGASTGPHLHLSYFVNGVTVDPLPYLSEPSNTLLEFEEMLILVVKEAWYLVVPQGNAKPRAVLLGGDSGAPQSGLPIIRAGQAQFTLDDLSKAVVGIRSDHLKA